MEALVEANIQPRSVLEIGCANGWRLKLLENKYKCMTTGVEPAPVHTGNIIRGMAHNIPINQLTFDLVIYGWCLYLCDREDLFKIASEGDRVLQDEGFLLIYDFHPFSPHRRTYKHKEGLFSFKMDHSKLWLANPAYSLYRRYMHGPTDDPISVTILKKNTVKGWPLHD